MIAAEKKELNRIYLQGYSDLIKEILNEEERLSSLNVSGLKSPSMDGQISGETAGGLDTKVIMQLEIKEHLDKLRAREKTMRTSIENALKSLEPDEKQIVRLKYIDLHVWNDITRIMFRKRSDYEEKIDNYKRLTFRIHEKALSKMIIWTEE